jgi:hypothetical protein
MPARYVRPYSKGPKNDFRDAEAILQDHAKFRLSTQVIKAGIFEH